MKQISRYIFILLLIIMLYLIYLVLSYKYTEYKIVQYMSQLQNENIQTLAKIEQTKQTLENKSTKAYKNKILKAERGMKNNGENVIFFIEEESYNKYTGNDNPQTTGEKQNQDLLGEESLISTMNIYQKWIYLIFSKDIR